MALNLYASLAEVQAAMDRTGDGDESELERVAERVSRAFDDETHRVFYSYLDTRYFDTRGGRVLFIDDDLVSVTTLKVDGSNDGSFEETLTEGLTNDFVLAPFNESAKTMIELRPGGSRNAWPWGSLRVEVDGIFGFGAETELPGDTVRNAPLTAAGLTLDVADGTLFSVGQTLVIEDEQVYISGISTNALTITRAANGTIAAEYAQDTVISRVKYHEVVNAAVVAQSTRLFLAERGGFSGDIGGEPGGFSFASTYPMIRDLIAGARRMLV